MVRASLTIPRALVGALIAILLTTGCRADVAVDVEVADDGSGLVTAELVLDAEATDGLADLGVDATLPLSDLAQTGWDVVPPETDAGGQTTITASKAFGTPAQFSEVMDDLTGPDGVFRDFELVRQQTFGRVDYSLSGVVDPSDGFDSFGDEELTTALGRSLSSIAVSPPYEASPEDVGLSLTVHLPGEFQEEGSSGRIFQGELSAEAMWNTDLAGSEVDVSLLTARRSTAAQVARGVAVVAAVLAAVVLLAQILRVFSARRRRLAEERARANRAAARRAKASSNAPSGPAAAGGGPTAQGSGDQTDSAEEEPAEAEPATYRVVALDGPGVLYREGDDIRKLLVPFARERGTTASPEEIADKARLLSLGRLTPADFWRIIGVEGDSNELDAAYLATHQLNPGVIRYLRALRDQGIKVACITNDSAAWAMKLRTGHSLGGFIDPWVVSGSVGVRKPERPLFEVLRRVTGEPPSAILVIDDDLDNLDAAQELGFATRWFSRDGDAADSRDHEVMRGFDGADQADTGELTLSEERPPPSDSPTHPSPPTDPARD